MFTIINAYTDKPIAVIYAPNSDKPLYAAQDIYIIDGEVFAIDSLPFLQIKNNAIDLINELTGEKIFSVYSQKKQANLQARHSELMAILDGKFAVLNELTSEITMQTPRPLTALEMTELLTIQVAWAWIKSVRALSNVANENIGNTTTQVEIDSIVSSYKANLLTI